MTSEIPPKRLRKHPCNGVSGAFFNRCKAEIYGYYCCFRVPSGRPACLASRQGVLLGACPLVRRALSAHPGFQGCSTIPSSLKVPEKALVSLFSRRGRRIRYQTFRIVPFHTNAVVLIQRRFPPSSRTGATDCASTLSDLFHAQRASCSSIASVMERACRAIVRSF